MDKKVRVKRWSSIEKPSIVSVLDKKDGSHSHWVLKDFHNGGEVLWEEDVFGPDEIVLENKKDE